MPQVLILLLLPIRRHVDDALKLEDHEHYEHHEKYEENGHDVAYELPFQRLFGREVDPR